MSGRTFSLTLVTGGTGFIGDRLVAALRRAGAAVRVLTRRQDVARAGEHQGGLSFFSGDLCDRSSLRGLCDGVETVFHCAGLAHTEARGHEDYAGEQWRTTVGGTENLLDEAAGKVRNIIYLSSVKAMGEGGEQELDESCAPHPEGAYGQARLAAEARILEFGSRQGVKAGILRLSMVYGAGCKGNVPRMIAAVDHNRFPPLPDAGNRRSMVHVDDVVQAALLAADSERASGQVYIVTDGRTYSTRQMYVWICQALGRPVPGWTLPLSLLRGAALAGDAIGAIRGRRFALDSDALGKLLGSAWYSSRKITDQLGYRPTRDLEAALPEMIACYRQCPCS
ncbi:MAG: NAD-dependent epimerase/dehydratase family protein [Gammaproteobacteria bacterium]|nr:NAD-dependent epimerase/dehydratase family protein [Gammaproteobacteria bacterium]